jgi:hypothetical protein
MTGIFYNAGQVFYCTRIHHRSTAKFVYFHIS